MLVEVKTLKSKRANGGGGQSLSTCPDWQVNGPRCTPNLAGIEPQLTHDFNEDRKRMIGMELSTDEWGNKGPVTRISQQRLLILKGLLASIKKSRKTEHYISV